MLMLPFSCDGAVCPVYLQFWQTSLEFYLSRSVCFVSNSVVFLFELRSFSSNEIPIHDVIVCHSNDSFL